MIGVTLQTRPGELTSCSSDVRLEPLLEKRCVRPGERQTHVALGMLGPGGGGCGRRKRCQQAIERPPKASGVDRKHRPHASARASRHLLVAAVAASGRRRQCRQRCVSASVIGCRLFTRLPTIPRVADKRKTRSSSAPWHVLKLGRFGCAHYMAAPVQHTAICTRGEPARPQSPQARVHLHSQPTGALQLPALAGREALPSATRLPPRCMLLNLSGAIARTDALCVCRQGYG